MNFMHITLHKGGWKLEQVASFTNSKKLKLVKEGEFRCK